VAVLPDGLDFLCVALLSAVRYTQAEESEGCQNDHKMRTY